VPVGRLPEPTVSAYIQRADDAALALVAPRVAERGPFELTQSGSWSSFSPDGARFAYIDEQGLFVVDAWPPEPRSLEMEDAPREFSWLDAVRLVVTTDRSIELVNVQSGSRETLVVAAPAATELRTLYLTRPSPDARWVAFARYEAGLHQAWLLDLEAPERPPVLSHTLEQGAVLAWFDWAPDSDHLAISATSPDGPWLRAYSMATRGDAGPVVPFTIPLDETSSVPTYQWSPSGDSLHYYYQHVDPATNESEFRLYLVDMSAEAPKESVLLSTFNERYWSSDGMWSPDGSHVAFHAQFAGTTYRSAQFASRMSAPTAPIKQHAGEFELVLRQSWSPDSQALYFTGRQVDQVERLYKSDLSGEAVQLSQATASVSGLYVSSVPGCIAYSQFLPVPALTIVNENTTTYFEIGQPEWNDPCWTGNFDSSFAVWVSGASGLRGLLYITNSLDIGDTLAWASVDGCVPSKPYVLIAGKERQSISIPSVSTAPRMEERL
jgi:Tol biopolymer transport system component